MDEHDPMEVNNTQSESEVELLVAVQHDQLEIDNQQLQPEPELPVTMRLIETYDHLKIEIIELFQMLKVTRSSSQHLALALQINPSLQLLRQFDQQVEEQINVKHEAISHGFARQTFAIGTELGASKMDDSIQVDESSTTNRELKVRRLDKLVAKSSVASASVTKQVTSSICPATASVFNHANSRKRKGIPRRAPLM
ncbi:hypothetical protein RHMOL_Rhmol11G0190300 [Rhododendron molle]|uniref:Uncharacterized protein n=1 Tax=Rhododendron molle TaxID=49168 RepID=A0ACC0LVJ3_RHOML|nr:hypothetical protein RHMOL_Rhmol11G0190300 [Rhododendron molle]